MILVKSYKILVNILQDLDKDETRFVPFRKDLRGSLRKYGKFLANLYKFSSQLFSVECKFVQIYFFRMVPK